MIEATNLKNGVTFLSNGKPYIVIKYNHIKVGRGGAIVRVSSRNLETGAIEEKTYSSNIKVEDIKTQKQKLQYLYNDGTNAVFMNPTNYEQVEIPIKVVSYELKFIKEGDNVDILMWDDKPLSVEISPKVVLMVKSTVPGVKGNSATNMFKPATLENGLDIKVPLFIHEGDNIRVDTRNGEYVERAN